jgi:hypothetical protein
VRYSRDGGKTWETSIRRAHVFSRHIEFASESADGLYPALRLPSADSGHLEVFGLVYSVLQNYE